MDNVGIVVESLDAAISFLAELGLELEGRAMIQELCDRPAVQKTVSHHGRSLLVIAGALVLALLSACSYTPSAVENRAKLRSCGEYEIGNEPSSPERLRKNRCILDALAEGRQAE